MGLIKIIVRGLISLIESIITTLICNLIFAIFNGVDCTIDNFAMFLYNNLTIFLILFIIFFIIFYQRKRMTESKELYGPDFNSKDYGVVFFPYGNLLWEICIEHSEYSFSDPPYFDYYVGRPLCPFPRNGKPCLTPLVISDNLIFYTEYCANCKKKYLRFKSYDMDKYEIQTIIDSIILRNNVQKANELVDSIREYVEEINKKNSEN